MQKGPLSGYLAAVQDGSLPDAHGRDAADVTAALQVLPSDGLSETEVLARRRQYGLNRLQAAQGVNYLQLLWRQVANPIMALLIAALAIAFLFGDMLEAAAISAVIALNAALGFGMEARASRAIAALKAMGGVTARVVRDGVHKAISADDLTLGDIVVLEAGDIVPADLRLVEAAQVQVDESTLTGESLPVAKTVAPVAAETLLAERASMLYRATSVTAGSARGVVTAIGLKTEVGRISALVASAEESRTPLEVRLSTLAMRLLWLTLILAVVIAAAGVLAGRPLYTMVETAIALAVAAIPEGLPVVAALTLARGVLRMAGLNALVRRLSAVEALGATTVILTDKTGTLTENRMTATTAVVAGERIALPHPAAEDLLAAAALCSNASLVADGSAVGDPMEVAILRAAALAGLEKMKLEAERPRCREEAFSPLTKMMATVHEMGGGRYVAVKGAPEKVIAHTASEASPDGPRPLDAAGRQRWLRYNADLAREGLRILAVARRHDGADGREVYEDLELLGLLGFADPARPDVPPAIAECRSAGLKVVMITGDQADTARAIARDVGIEVGDDGVLTGGDLRQALNDGAAADRLRRMTVFARVTPEDKLDLVSLFQAGGEVVAMTGDGVNDAPALKMADVGVAMGQRGTQVAREAADMVLRDDAFATIVAAVREGRVIFDNIRQSARYLLACNLSEVLVVGLAVISGMPLPLTALQILFLNLVTDVFPAVAIGSGEGGPDVMRQPPREKSEHILTPRHWRWVAVQGGALTASTLGAFAAVLWGGMGDAGEAETVAFLSLAVGQLAMVFATHSAGSSLWRNEIVRNPYVWAAVALCAGILFLAMGLPVLRTVLSLETVGGQGLGVIAVAGLAPLAVHELVNFSRRRG